MSKADIRMEYTTLRNEILKRIELRHQILLITLTAAGALLGFGVKQNNHMLALLYPPIAVLLASTWELNEHCIREAAKYILDKIEKPNPDLNWETHMEDVRKKKPISIRYVMLNHLGLILATQVIALVIGVSMYPWKEFNRETALFWIDIISVASVIYISTKAWQFRKRNGKEQSSNSHTN